jgi:hypothetical protein
VKDDFQREEKTMKKQIVASLMAAACGLASAELTNIAAGANQSATQAATVCTVVDAGTIPMSGSVLLVVLAEGSGNPDVRVWSMDRDYVTTNNNWGDGIDVTSGGATGHISLREIDPDTGLFYPSLLRAPAKVTDAAAFVAAKVGERICAVSYDQSGDGQQHFVALSITDMNAIAFKSQQLKLLGVADLPRDPREASVQKALDQIGANR